MEQYFRATQPESKDSKVLLVMMYLISDAKLSWCIWWEEIHKGRYNIDTWDVLKWKL